MQIFMQAANSETSTFPTLLYGCFSARVLSFYYLKRRRRRRFNLHHKHKNFIIATVKALSYKS